MLESNQHAVLVCILSTSLFDDTNGTRCVRLDEGSIQEGYAGHPRESIGVSLLQEGHRY